MAPLFFLLEGKLYPAWTHLKFIWLTVIALTLIALAGFLSSHTKKKSVTVKPDEQSYLQDQYRHLNDGYFDGQLPANTKVFFAQPPDSDEVIGETYCFDGPSLCFIYIVPKYNVARPIEVETLIHEMCHIQTYSIDFDHGPAWQQCMRSIADEGGFEGVW